MGRTALNRGWVFLRHEIARDTFHVCHLRNGGRGAVEVTKNLAFFDQKSTFDAPGEILRFAAFGGSLRMTGWEALHG
jgi:hypothetical protein